MLDGLFMLLALSVVMALSCFLAGALPLSMTLSSSQLRLISTIGMGVLVGTSLIVIIPEGIEAIYSAGSAEHTHLRRDIHVQERALDVRWVMDGTTLGRRIDHSIQERQPEDYDRVLPAAVEIKAGDPTTTGEEAKGAKIPAKEDAVHQEEPEHHEKEPPTFYIGLSLILGFILMFLIDKLPRRALENLQPPPPTRHISLDNLSQGLHSSSTLSVNEESESFLQSLTPSPKQTRSLATTTGLVIHAFADGIAMGASASAEDTSLGFIIFLAIMVHKAPAAFGLTSVLLKQGLSKRAARGHLVVFSLASPFGALSTWLLVSLLGGDHMEGEKGKWWTGMLLLFSAGTFLYVAMHAMQEDAGNHDHANSNGYAEGNGSQRKQPKPQMRDTLAAVGGMLIPLLTQVGHHH